MAMTEQDFRELRQSRERQEARFRQLMDDIDSGREARRSVWLFLAGIGVGLAMLASVLGLTSYFG